MSGSHKKLTFSDYFSFFRTRNGDELTYDQLVQVLYIHGFVKTRAHKHEVMEALASFDLMDPTRSMTHNGGSPLLGGGQVAAPSLKQIGRDIDEIGWEECPIGSIETVQPAQLAAEALIVSPSNSASLTQVTAEK
ncbi:hypothetical protein FCM35_KLT12661 [Carex littledalei]|uniref:DUF7787 domain-containing protein n=1 Tax=Carex littledalei TaxID=544730 RepID=A0A833QJB0_9POAL|nr:hypothetical protein FCM35_KLT12661 [Carex littledalei]